MADYCPKSHSTASFFRPAVRQLADED
ncbi:MAG: hypothetical protein ACD_57C00139G0005, partial [uncultured bacterium]